MCARTPVAGNITPATAAAPENRCCKSAAKVRQNCRTPSRAGAAGPAWTFPAGGKCSLVPGHGGPGRVRPGARVGGYARSSGRSGVRPARNETFTAGRVLRAATRSRDQPWWMRPAVRVSGRPEPPQRSWISSAATDTAVSSGVRAPRSRPIGDAQPGQLGTGQALLAQPLDPVVVGPPAAHRADVGGGLAQRHLEQRDVELGVVGQHADHRPVVGRPRLPGSGAASPPRPRPRRGTGHGWRTARGRRTRSPGSRGTCRPWRPRRRSRSRRTPASAAAARTS